MGEHIATAFLGLDEAETLGIVEPLDTAESHLAHSCRGAANHKPRAIVKIRAVACQAANWIAAGG
jgi:hypothetical protein